MIDVDDPLWESLRSAVGGCGGDQLSEAKRPHPPPASAEPRPSPSCPHCSSPVSGPFCSACSTVLERQLDYGAEWRFYGSEHDQSACNPTRCCPPSDGLIRSLGSVISVVPRRKTSQWTNRTANAAASSEAARDAVRSVQKYQVWSSMTYRERVLCSVFDVMSVNAAHNGLPACILEAAKNLYKRVSDARITRGENRSAVIAVSVYVACKKNGVPRSLREISSMFSIPVSALTKACRAVQHVIDDADAVSSVPTDFVGRFCSNLGLDPHVQAMARHVAAAADELGIISDAMPTTAAAGSISLAVTELGLDVSVEAISVACLVAAVTVVKTFRRLSPYKNVLLPPPPRNAVVAFDAVGGEVDDGGGLKTAA